MKKISKQVVGILLIFAVTLTSCRLGGRGDQTPPLSTPEPALADPTQAQQPPAPASLEPAPTSSEAAPSETEPSAEALDFVTGRNDYTIIVDDTPREFILYVPSGYDPSRPTPIVLMLHGSNQHPNNMYENTSWVRKAEEENIIVVFPASWQYPLLEGGGKEKWNTPSLTQVALPGTEFKDDVHFIRVLLEYLKATVNVDEKRIFASGFSNGGGFVITRLLLEMNDVFAAFATSGAGLLGEGSVDEITFTVNASLYNVIGTNDNKISEGQGIPLPFPIKAEDILNDPNFGGLLEKTTALLALDMSYTVESEPDFTRFTFNNSLIGTDNEYIFMMVKGLFHEYPSGDNNRVGLDVADVFWAFFMKHPKP